MCCDASLCSAQGEDVRLLNARHMQCSVTSFNRCDSGKSERTTRMRKRSLTKASDAYMSRATKKSVRQCARRCVHHIGVAQASPLFSDQAPREVHLWQ